MKYIYLTILCCLTIFSFSQEKKIEEIIIKGTFKTKKSRIYDLLETKKNKLLDSLVLKEDLIRLKRLPVISLATFQVKDTHKNSCIVYIHIEENFTLIPTVNIWTTTNKKVAYKLGLYDYNFLGKNMTFGGFYQKNAFHSYGLNFKAPTMFSKKWGVALSYQNWSSEEPLYFEEKSANYKYQNIAYEILGLWQINIRNSMQFGVNFFKEKYDYLTGHTSLKIPQKLNINKRLFKFVYTYNSLEHSGQNIGGFKNEFYGQYVTSNNKNQDKFLIAWNDFFYYRRMWSKGNWANRLRIGISSNIKSPFAPFALDNNVNLRGVGIIVDRGTGSIVWNTEYRHILYENGWFIFQGNTFADIGTWRLPGGELNDFFKEENVKVYSGIGLRLIHKKIYNAIFRIDYGFGLTKNASRGLVFGIGQYF